MEFTPAYVEAIVKRAYKRGKVLRVLQVDFDAAVEEGDNYTSDTKRVSARVIDTDGRSRKMSFFVKLAPSTPAKRAFIMGFALFPREIQMYRDILPAMEDLLRSNGDFSDCPWTSCLDFTPNNMILLQDLSLSDYQMTNRKEGLDFDHAALAVGALARFHALSVVLKEREEFKTSDFDRFIFSEEHPVTERLFSKGLTALIETMEATWSSDWSELLKDMKTLTGNVIGRIKKIAKRDENGFNVLNHGDPWTNNMLFKYCPYTGNLVGIKLVDLQLSHYGSYALDLAYLMFTSAQGSVRDRLEDILAIYHKTLVDTFKRVRHEPATLPTLEDVLAEYKKREAFGVIISIAMLHLFIADKENVKDLEEAVTNPDLEISQGTLLSERFTRKVQEILTPFKQGGYFINFTV